MDYYRHDSDRLYYRKNTAEHMQRWAAFFESTRDRLHFLTLDGTKSGVQYAKEWLERQEERYRMDECGFLTVFEKGTDEMVGMCGILKRDFESKVIYEIGYSFLPEHWGKGYATEAAKHLKHVGRNIGIAQNYVSMIHVDNVDSMRVAMRNDMVPLKKSRLLHIEVYIFGDPEVLA